MEYSSISDYEDDKDDESFHDIDQKSKDKIL